MSRVKNSRRADETTRWILVLGVLLSVATTLSVLVILGRESFHFFDLVTFKEFFFGRMWEPLIEPKSFGIRPLIIGTVMITLGATVIALPMGLFTAFYLSEMASTRIRNILKPALEILAGIPTVVFGYFALTTITPYLRVILPDLQIFNALSASIVVAIMILPMIASLCDDAFRALPQSLKEGGYALGATKNEVVWGVMLPACGGRVLAAVMLAMSRAAGETMAVTLAAGSSPNSSMNFLESVQTMTAFIVQVSLGDIQSGGVEYLSSFAVGAMLFIITLILNGMGAYLIFKSPRGVS
jgi:phosphate transport system permease protein